MSLIYRVAKKYGLKASNVDDIIVSLCILERKLGIADKLQRNKLDIRKAIKSGYGFGLQTKYRVHSEPLSTIQEKRLECDVLYVITNGEVKGTSFTMPLIDSMKCAYYEDDINVCNKYLRLYEESLQSSICVDEFIEKVSGVAPYYHFNDLVLSKKYSCSRKDIKFDDSDTDYRVAIADNILSNKLKVKDKLYLALDIMQKCKNINTKQKLVVSEKTLRYLQSIGEVYEVLSKYFVFSTESEGVESSVLQLGSILYGKRG